MVTVLYGEYGDRNLIINILGITRQSNGKCYKENVMINGKSLFQAILK